MNRRQRRRAEARLGKLGGAASGSAAPIAGWLSAALAHQRGGRMADAERVCRQILSVDPGHAQTLHLLGLIEHQLAPDAVDTLYNLGSTWQDLGQPDRAIAYFERALRLRPDAIELHHNLGSALQDLGRLDEAIACYRKVLALRPDAVDTLDNLAGALRAQRQLDAAQDCYERALALRPDRVESHTGLGVILRDRGHLEEAVACHERALALKPDHPETLNNLGLALVDIGRREEAVAHYERSLALQPDRAETHYNLAIALERQRRYAEALACYRRALARKPDYAQAHFNRSLTLLLTGQFDEGWEEYEWRFVVARYDRNFDRPLWSGDPLAGERILIHAEQGFGDTLQFIRYIPVVAERGGRVVLEVPGPLVRLARTVAGASEVVAAGDPPPGFDCHCPLLSLPRVFKTNLATIPAVVPYLSVREEASATWAERITTAPGLRVGVVWAGTTVGATDLLLLQPLWDVRGISWFSLQVGDRSRDISVLDGVKITDLSPCFTDFTETATAVSRLDLVISVDTSVAHLAGALGRPVWLMLPNAPDWRWLLDREDSPWYPTARLFRQKKPGDWSSVAREVAAALAHHASRPERGV
jgi:tetratricopeptide (TPR) repeat protein